MKKNLLLWLLVAVSAGCDRHSEQTATNPTVLSALPAVTKDPVAGRYQLVQAEYETETTAPVSRVDKRKRALFRIDTQTGRTWVFVDYYDPDTKKVREFWFLLYDDPLFPTEKN
jgi:hypothetical protein